MFVHVIKTKSFEHMHLKHLLSFPHCVSPMRIMVNNHSYLPIFGHCGWNVPRQAVCAPSVLFLAFLSFVFFFNFICLFGFFCPFFIGGMSEWWNDGHLPFCKEYLFPQRIAFSIPCKMHLFFDMTLQNIFSCNPQWKVVANLPVKVHLASEQVLKPSLGNWMSYLGLITLSFMFLGRLKCSYLRIFEKICNSFVSV